MYTLRRKSNPLSFLTIKDGQIVGSPVPVIHDERFSVDQIKVFFGCILTDESLKILDDTEVAQVVINRENDGIKIHHGKSGGCVINSLSDLKRPDFKKALEGLINSYSQESCSNTPDFVLADFLQNCLNAFNASVNNRGLLVNKGQIHTLSLINAIEKVQYALGCSVGNPDKAEMCIMIEQAVNNPDILKCIEVLK
jgi:hypothetical protein